MKFGVYAALIASVIAAEEPCKSDATAAAYKARDTLFTALEASRKLKTAEITTFETALDKANAHLVEVKALLVTAQALEPADAAKVTEAESNIKIAEAAVTKVATGDNAADYNKVLLTIDTDQKAYDDALVAAGKAVSDCVPALVKAQHDKQAADMKKWKGYDAMSVEDKAKMDAAIKERVAKVAKQDGETRYTAEYHKMDQAEKDMYNKILIAQKVGKHSDMAEKYTELEKKKTEAGYADMSAEKKAAFDKIAMMKMKSMQMRGDGEGNEDMKARAKFAYSKMDASKKAMVDKMLKTKGEGRKTDGIEWKKKLEAMKTTAGWAKMTDTEQAQFMERALLKFKDAWQRKDKYGAQDDDERKKAGYFSKMKEGARGVFDGKLASMVKKRMADNGDFDKMKEAAMTKDGYSKMDASKKMAYLKQMMAKRSEQDGSRQKGSMSDMAKRLKTDYYNRSSENRADYDKGMKFSNEFKKGMTSAGTEGSTCTPRTKEDADGKSWALKKQEGKVGPQCGFGLCCGTARQAGLYEASYTVCGSKTAVQYKGMEFKCIDGAKNLVAGAAALFATAYLMA